MPKLDYSPIILIQDTTKLTREEWLEARRQGIGGNDAAIVMEESPWKTKADLYLDKLGLAPDTDDENWVQKEIGKLLEPLIAKIFEKKTGFQIVDTHAMYQHPIYPFMIADIDYLIQFDDGTYGILECKHTDRYNLGEWENDSQPYHYTLQGAGAASANRQYYTLQAGRNFEGLPSRTLRGIVALLPPYGVSVHKAGQIQDFYGYYQSPLSHLYGQSYPLHRVFSSYLALSFSPTHTGKTSLILDILIPFTAGIVVNSVKKYQLHKFLLSSLCCYSLTTDNILSVIRISNQADDSTVNVIKHAIWNTMSIFIGQGRNLQNYLQMLMNGAILIILVMVTT